MIWEVVEGWIVVVSTKILLVGGVGEDVMVVMRVVRAVSSLSCVKGLVMGGFKYRVGRVNYGDKDYVGGLD